MTEPNCTTGAADANLIRNDTADAQTVRQFRSELSGWLRAHFVLDSTRLSDVLLAVNEALTNAAEFAYAGRQGTMTMQARHQADDGSLVVLVSDRGTWREAGPKARLDTRGRGIPLMRALADHATISRQPIGTEVRLQFDDCAPVSGRACVTSA